MARIGPPLFPTDDGWPYADGVDDVADPEELDLDALELQVDPRAYHDLTPAEATAVRARFGLDGGPPTSTKELARRLECTRAEVRDLLGRGLAKLRSRLALTD